MHSEPVKTLELPNIADKQVNHAHKTPTIQISNLTRPSGLQFAEQTSNSNLNSTTDVFKKQFSNVNININLDGATSANHGNSCSTDDLQHSSSLNSQKTFHTESEFYENASSSSSEPLMATEMEIDLDGEDINSMQGSNGGVILHSTMDEDAATGLMKLALKSKSFVKKNASDSDVIERLDGFHSAAASAMYDGLASHNRNGQSHFQPVASQSSMLASASALTPSRRQAHIASEQKRRQHINEGFEELRVIVPTCRNANDSKASILKKTVHYVKFLESKLAETLRIASAAGNGTRSGQPQNATRLPPLTATLQPMQVEQNVVSSNPTNSLDETTNTGSEQKAQNIAEVTLDDQSKQIQRELSNETLPNSVHLKRIKQEQNASCTSDFQQQARLSDEYMNRTHPEEEPTAARQPPHDEIK